MYGGGVVSKSGLQNKMLFIKSICSEYAAALKSGFWTEVSLGIISNILQDNPLPSLGVLVYNWTDPERVLYCKEWSGHFPDDEWVSELIWKNLNSSNVRVTCENQISVLELQKPALASVP